MFKRLPAITITKANSKQHCDLSSNRDHDKDYYDGLLDITVHSPIILHRIHN